MLLLFKRGKWKNSERNVGTRVGVRTHLCTHVLEPGGSEVQPHTPSSPRPPHTNLRYIDSISFDPFL